MKNVKSEEMETQSILSTSRSVTIMESEVKTPWAENYLKRLTHRILAECSVSTTSGSKFARYLIQKVPDRLYTLAQTVEKNLKL